MGRGKHVPQRQCVACRQMRAKRELLRVVRTPSGEVRVDATGKVSGRGAYVCPTPGCADQALREHRLEHALEVSMPEEAVAALRAAVQSLQTPGRV
jgi:hypothetical protein